jgi:hypothetical protein
LQFNKRRQFFIRQPCTLHEFLPSSGDGLCPFLAPRVVTANIARGNDSATVVTRKDIWSAGVAPDI